MDGEVPTDGEEEAAVDESVCIGINFLKTEMLFLQLELTELRASA